jgi:hypothetical protein
MGASWQLGQIVYWSLSGTHCLGKDTLGNFVLFMDEQVKKFFHIWEP